MHNTIAPYRHPLFEGLSKHLHLMVYYCSLRRSSRKWDSWPRNYDYRYKILPRIPIGEFSLNPSVVKELFLSRPRVLVLGGYTDATMWLAFGVGLLLRIPAIFWTEGTEEPQSVLGAVTRPLRILCLRKSSAVVVPGRVSKSYAISLGASVEKVFVAPNTIDNELYIRTSNQYRIHREEMKAELGLKGKVVILYAGRLVKEKGIEFLLRAYKELKSEIDEIALVVVGYGDLYETLQKICQEERINDVKLIGAVENYRQMIACYSAADVLVLPTLADVWGFVINEAMACGLPIVATYASQAAQEMIHCGDNGYVVNEADSEELYSVLKNLISDIELRERMAERSREIVQRDFDVSHMVNGFLSAIKYCDNCIGK